MDVRQYFRKVREVENGIADEYPLIVSLETADGGKEGKVTEVSRSVGAKMIVEGRAVLASQEVQDRYRETLAESKRNVEAAEVSRRVQVAIISDPDLHAAVKNKKTTTLPGSGK